MTETLLSLNRINQWLNTDFTERQERLQLTWTPWLRVGHRPWPDGWVWRWRCCEIWTSCDWGGWQRSEGSADRCPAVSLPPGPSSHALPVTLKKQGQGLNKKTHLLLQSRLRILKAPFLLWIEVIWKHFKDISCQEMNDISSLLHVKLTS